MSFPINPQKVLASLPWYERAIAAVAPSYGNQRLTARLQRELFAYQGARADRLYSPKTNNAPSEGYQTARDRVVMMFEALDLVENFPPAKAAVSKFATFLTPNEYAPATGNRTYDAIVADYFHAWCKSCDVTGRHSFRKLIQLLAEMRPCYGDAGLILRRTAAGLKVEAVAGDRIGNPNEMIGQYPNYLSGVVVDDMGAPEAFRIFRVQQDGQYVDPTDIPAASFCHYFDPFRADQYRGVTDFHAVLKTCRMLKEILEAEMVGVRFASQQAALVFTERGAANPRNLFQPSSNEVGANGQRPQQEESKIGTIQYLYNGDKVETMPARPSSAFTGFVDELKDDIALGLGGYPGGVLWGTADYKGPSVRAEFAQADRVNQRHQGLLEDKVLSRVSSAVILDAIATGIIPPPTRNSGETTEQAIVRATRGSFRFPPRLTIDVGRETQARLAELSMGIMSPQEIAAEDGMDAYVRATQKADFAAFAAELAESRDVPESSIFLPAGQQLPSTPAQAASIGDKTGHEAAAAQAESVPQAQKPTEGPAPADPVSAVRSENDSNLLTINLETGSYIPTNAMAENAKRALDVREKKPASERGMTAVGIARARDLINKRPMSEDTVRRMKAFFDRHEVDKEGDTWDEQGKGWQAWHGWGGDEGYTWSTAIVERLNKQADSKELRMASAEVRQTFAAIQPPEPEEWLDAVQRFREKQNARVDDIKQSIVGDRTIIEMSKRDLALPKPTSDETHDEFMTRCMADPVSVAEFPDTEQRNAVCMRQHEGMFAKVGERGAIVKSDKAPKSDTPNPDPKGEGTAEGDASTTRGAEVTAEQEATLQKKADDFNKKDSNTRNGRATLGALKSVFQRGLGAFNTSSSPRVTSASQWAFARVNAFLYLLKNGRPENAKYTTDNDLLPSKHPKSGK
jgi:capsid protein